MTENFKTNFRFPVVFDKLCERDKLLLMLGLS